MSSESQKKKSKSEKSKSEKSGQNDSSDVIIEDVLESADSSTDKHDVEMSSTNTNSSSSVGSSLTGSESAGGRPSTSTQAENKDEPVDGTKEFWKHVLVQGGCELSGERVDWCATTLHEKDWKKSAFLDLTAAELRTLYGRDKSTRPDGLSDGEANSVAKAIKKYADKEKEEKPSDEMAIKLRAAVVKAITGKQLAETTIKKVRMEMQLEVGEEPLKNYKQFIKNLIREEVHKQSAKDTSKESTKDAEATS